MQFNRASWVSLSLAVVLASWNSAAARSQHLAKETGLKTLSEKILAMERGLEGEFEGYFNRDLAEVTQTPEAIARTLSRLAQETGTRPAVLWAIPREDHLHLVLITPDGEPIVRDLYDVPRSVLLEVARTFHGDLTSDIGSPMNLDAARQLHQWIIEPYESEYLQPEAIDTLLVCLGDGIRGLPLAALHDGSKFLVETYALARIPAFNLISTDYDRLQPNQVLAMGASEFREQVPLPAVPLELSLVVGELRRAKLPQDPWLGQLRVNQTFTLQTLANSLAAHSFDIVHLATHAEFQPGEPDNSYIQFWDAKLRLDAIGELAWNRSQVELLVLSACKTAVGSREAELGFAGLTLQAGVKTAVASLWYVSDTGTLALTSEFYRQLPAAPTKAEALRRAQLRLLRGEVRLESDRLLLTRGSVPVPESLGQTGESEFSHPFYWASFTAIGSPW